VIHFHHIKFRLFSLIALVWGSWYLFAGPLPAFDYIAQHWPITVTMVFGSLIAGATSEGGGAVAFPIFTKLLNISPQDAKVFSLAIQSVGMSAASLIILALKIKVEWRVILWASSGGFFGMLIGAGLLSPLLPAAFVKMLFTVMVVSFAMTLFLLNRGLSLRNKNLQKCNRQEILCLLATGFLGGIMSGLVGNGIDVITFSVMVLLFRINEKIATPTSVILMAINAIFGFFLHYFYFGGFNETVHAYWLAAIPVVVLGAPLGAILCYYMSRVFIVNFLIFLIIIEFVSSLLLIPLTVNILLLSGLLLIIFSIIYLWMYRSNHYLPNNRSGYNHD